MVGHCRRLRLLATPVALAVAAAFALAPSAYAQWFLPFGAAPPAEIVNRLRAEGYVLARPLERRDTVYLADVVRGPHGRERLVVDAWSGEILQRFLARRGGFVPEGGEFSEPPPLGPPPARDFREGDFGYGPPGFEAPPPKTKARQRPSATAHKGGEPKPTPPSAEPAEPQNAGSGSPGAVPAAPRRRPRLRSTRPRTRRRNRRLRLRTLLPPLIPAPSQKKTFSRRQRPLRRRRRRRLRPPRLRVLRRRPTRRAKRERRKSTTFRSTRWIELKRKGALRGRPSELPVDLAYAALAAGASIVLPELIGIVRGFCASGTSRTKSIWSSPFSQVAPVATTWSASWKRRSNARAAIP